MKKLFCLSLLIALSTACVYTPAIQQGNILQQEEVNKIEPGMTKEQIAFILGKPALDTNLEENTWYYLYYLKPTSGDTRSKRLILHFVDNKLERMEGTIKPEKES
ncbi:outer membrane protein assembly factor BamE [Kangiella spongicola]|uniref:Outer membrane protein assembly factor BamE n=1 Tax=Kangiella spongicola TaxID=796379 RepID=A0A318DA40_9GAMM|nr:outer membrane protein assembly factor BamE [Kangiella spongicola]MBV34883.1 cell envelope protein SmpA [Rickettsiales bacterium]PXF64114.1 cell envelope protein SmpA [Kangiella spongicola]